MGATAFVMKRTNGMRYGIRVDAEWDSEAGVWVAESEDVAGLVAEAETLEALTEKLRSLIPELIELNDVRVATNHGDLPLDVFARRHVHTYLAGGDGIQFNPDSQALSPRARLHFR